MEKFQCITAAKSPRMDTSKRVRTIVSHYTHNPSSEVAELKAKCQKRFRRPDFFHRGKQKCSFPRCSPGGPLPSLSPRTLSGSVWVSLRSWEQAREVGTHSNQDSESNKGMWILLTASKTPSGGQCWGCLASGPPKQPIHTSGPYTQLQFSGASSAQWLAPCRLPTVSECQLLQTACEHMQKASSTL